MGGSVDCLPRLGHKRSFKLSRKLLICIGLALLAGCETQIPRAFSQQPITTKQSPAAQAEQTPQPQLMPEPGPTSARGVSIPRSIKQIPSPVQDPNLVTLAEALRLANAQASSFQQAALTEQIAAEDVRQAQAAFLPRVTAPVDYIFTSPLMGATPGTPRVQSFIAANAVSEYQALFNLAGDLDVAGRLRATLAKNRALLAAAHAGTEIARRALAQSVLEAYYGLALGTAQRRAAEQNLAAAEEFEKVTSVLLGGGEVAPVDLTRAKLQTTSRRDELEKARADEVIAAGALRVLVGYDFLKSITTIDLAVALPATDDVSSVTSDLIAQRPEFAQFEAQRLAAQQEIRAVRAERLPQLSYSISGGFDTDSLRPPRLKEHSGVSASFNLSIPIFDWGASKSRERQARLRAQISESQRLQALRGFAEQFYTARAQAVSAAARTTIATSGIAQAETNLNASIVRYQNGEAQIIEVIDAQTTLVEQRQALYQALFDYQVALGRLRQTTGR